jgi:hypothetical protein
MTREEWLRRRVRTEALSRGVRRRFHTAFMREVRARIQENGGVFDVSVLRRVQDDLDRLMARYYAAHPEDERGEWTALILRRVATLGR